MIKPSFTLPTPKKGSERAELIGFFHERIFTKTLKRYRPAFIATKMAHLSLKDLFYLKSIFSDIQARKGNDAANKYWWWSLKANT